MPTNEEHKAFNVIFHIIYNKLMDNPYPVKFEDLQIENPELGMSYNSERAVIDFDCGNFHISLDMTITVNKDDNSK